MARKFITESMDSRHVSLGNFANPDYRHHVLRLRLNVVARILLGHSMIVPQGWAMDSLPLFQVIDEILDARRQILKDLQGKDSQEQAAAIRAFSPFVRESHVGDLSYADMLLLYLKRDDCYWAGLPPLRDAKCREYLHDELVNGMTSRSFDSGCFKMLARDCLEGDAADLAEEVSGYWAGAFAYFSEFERQNPLYKNVRPERAFARRETIDMPQGAYRGNVAQALAAACTGNDMDDPALQDIIRFNDILARYPGTQSTSRILSMANSEIENADARDAILHISTSAHSRKSAPPRCQRVRTHPHPRSPAAARLVFWSETSCSRTPSPGRGRHPALH